MAKRRDAGDGALYQRKSGDKRWVGSFRIEGKRKKYVYAKTKSAAREKLRRAKLDHEQGKLLTTPTQTFAVYFKHWLLIRRASLKPGVSVAYERFGRLHLVPVLGHLKLQKITREVVEQLILDLLEKDLEHATVRYIVRVLSSALQDACEWHKIPYNPVRGVHLPREEKYDGTVLDVEQARHLMEVARKTRLECAVILAITTGMRKGELLALTWDDMTQEGILHVKHTLSYLPDDTGHKRFVVTEPKSEAGIRPILMPQIVLDALREHRKHQVEKRLAAAPGWQQKNLVFGSLKHGGYQIPTSFDKQWKRLLRMAGLPDTMHFHDLRHSAATILISQGVSPKVVQELLGHASIRTTLELYVKNLPTMQKGAMDLLDKLYRDEAVNEAVKGEGESS